MTTPLLLQPARVPLGTDKNGDPVLISRPWYRVLEGIASAQVQASNAAIVTALAAEVEAMALELLNMGSTDIVAPIQAANDGDAGEMIFAPINHFPAAGVVLPTFVDNEIPTGAINGSNTVYALAQSPNPASSLSVFLNGVRLALGADYSLAGATLTYVAAPASGDTHLVGYRY